MSEYFSAFLAEEPLEVQLHSHRIDRGDSQAVTDRAVGSGSAALREDSFPIAEER